jgi:hypothetical protein
MAQHQPIKREKHFLYWMLLTVFSLIALTSFTNYRDGPWSRQSRWVISVTSISMGLSAIGAVASLLMKEKFSTTSAELGLIVIILGFWCAGLPSILDPSHRFAQIGEASQRLYDFNVWNVNLFFFSWGAFIVGLKLFGLHLAELLKRKDDKYISSWILLTAASFVTMASASHIWRDGRCDNTDITMCARILFAIILGAISGLVGMILIFVPSQLIHLAMAIILLAAWCFEISYITFDQGPATLMNTLYFSSWAALITSLCIAALALAEKLMGSSEYDTEEPAQSDRPAGHTTMTTTTIAKHVVDIKNDPEDREFEEVAQP